MYVKNVSVVILVVENVHVSLATVILSLSWLLSQPNKSQKNIFLLSLTTSHIFLIECSVSYSVSESGQIDCMLMLFMFLIPLCKSIPVCDHGTLKKKMELHYRFSL